MAENRALAPEVAYHRSFHLNMDTGSIPAPEALRHPLEPRQEPLHRPHFYLYRFIARPRYQTLPIRLTFDYFRRPGTRQGTRSSIQGHPARPFFAGKPSRRVKKAELAEKHRQFAVLPRGSLLNAPKSQPATPRATSPRFPASKSGADHEIHLTARMGPFNCIVVRHNQRRQQSNLGLIRSAAYGPPR